jgi:hypothetical protein
LQNINPFEEGFRRAAEDNSNGVIRDSFFLTTPSSQDTLHTPQILPQFDPRMVKTEQPIQDEPENLTVPSTPEDLSNIPKTIREAERLESNVNDLINSQKAMQLPIPLLPKPSVIYAAPLISTASLTTATPATFNLGENQEDNKNESVKDRLKNILLSNPATFEKNKRIKTEPMPTIFLGAVPLIAAPQSLVINNAISKLKVVNNEARHDEILPAKTSESGSGSRKRSRVDKPDPSNLKVERNRAAARRYR